VIATRTIPTHNALPRRSAVRGIANGLALAAGFWAVLAAVVIIAAGGIG